MKATLIERNPSGKAMVSTLDFRGGKTVDDVADELRARDVGLWFTRWWVEARELWVERLVDMTVRPPRVMQLDLRKELLAELVRGGRLSLIPRWCSVLPDERSMLQPGHATHENLAAMGRDLIAWWQERAGQIQIDGRSFPALLNQSFKNFWLRRGKSRRGVAAQETG